jgi:serralysin
VVTTAPPDGRLLTTEGDVVLRRTLRPALGALAATLLAAVTALSSGTVSGFAAEDPNYGPPYNYTTELVAQYKFVALPGVAMLTRTEHGYVYRTGGQDSHLVVTKEDRRLRLVDTGTRKWKKLSPACERQRVPRGIAAVCRIPRGVTTRQPLLLEVWPRLGDDFTDGSTLPATIAMTVLSDGGHDVAYLGAGPDFFNGYTGRDRVTGGAGKDWIRIGAGNDAFWGGPGSDKLIGMDGRDRIAGGEGDDRIMGMAGNDTIRGNTGDDFIVCGSGWDEAPMDDADNGGRWDCESQ